MKKFMICSDKSLNKFIYFDLNKCRQYQAYVKALFKSFLICNIVCTTKLYELPSRIILRRLAGRYKVRKEIFYRV